MAKETISIYESSTISLKACSVCPRNCLVERDKKLGICRKRNEIEITWYGPHFGEEPPISGLKDREPFFLAGATCYVFIVKIGKYPREILISKKYSIDKVADIFLELQNIRVSQY